MNDFKISASRLDNGRLVYVRPVGGLQAFACKLLCYTVSIEAGWINVLASPRFQKTPTDLP